MRTPTLGDVLAAVLSCVAIGTAAVGAFVGTVSSLLGLTALLTARVMAGRSEARRWRQTPLTLQNTTAVEAGPLSEMTSEIRRAAAGDRYSRADLATLLSWLASAKSEGPEEFALSEMTTARRVLLAGSRDPAKKEMFEAEGSLAASHLKGKDFVLELEREMNLIRDV